MADKLLNLLPSEINLLVSQEMFNVALTTSELRFRRLSLLADPRPLILQVLCPSAPPCCQLPQEEVWTHQQPSPQEEAEVDSSIESALDANLC